MRLLRFVNFEYLNNEIIKKLNVPDSAAHGDARLHIGPAAGDREIRGEEGEGIFLFSLRFSKCFP